MDLLIGTSGFAYKAWYDIFYPKGLPSSGMLRYYAEHFGAVEINSTFFRMPTEAALRQWAADVPAGFRFALKSPQLITHRKRLKEVDEPVAAFFRVSHALETHLGPLLFQLPPNFKKDLDRLEKFLDLVPKDARVAVEFRHQSWFDDDVFDALRNHGAALCIAHGEDQDAPRVATTDWGLPAPPPGHLYRCGAAGVGAIHPGPELVPGPCVLQARGHGYRADPRATAERDLKGPSSMIPEAVHPHVWCG